MTRTASIALAGLAIMGFTRVVQEVPLPDWMEGRTLEPTYTEGAGLVYEHRCATCHRDGGVGPMSFETLDDIREWSVGTQLSMTDAVTLRLMPPWPADPSVGSFSNDLRMTDAEIELIERWISAGYPAGYGHYGPPSSTAPWSLGIPDAVFDLPSHVVAADAVDELVETVIRTDYAEDRWIVAAEALPGSFPVVTEIDAGPLGQYRPGSSAVAHAPGTGTLLPAGAEILVTVRYRNRIGEERTDVSRLAVYYADDPGAEYAALLSEHIVSGPVTLAAGERGREVHATSELPAGAWVHSLHPSMGELGVSMAISATGPDGTRTPLLSVPRWDPLWQLNYQLREPLYAPAGTRVEVTATFDNSLENMRSPDPWSYTDDPGLAVRLLYSLNPTR